MGPKDADGMANSVDPDQTAPLFWVYAVSPYLSVQKLRIFTVPYKMDRSDLTKIHT